MNYSLFIFILLVASSALILWIFCLRRISTIEVWRLFEPATYNLILFTFTGLIGVLAVFYLSDYEYFNKIVYTYNNSQINLILVYLCMVIFVTMTFLSRINQKNSFSLLSIPQHKTNELVLYGIIAILIISLIPRLSSLNDFMLASDQYEIMSIRKSVDTAWITFFLNKTLIEGILWVFVLQFIISRRNNLNFSQKITISIIVILFLLYYFTSYKKLPMIYFAISIFAAGFFNKKISVISLIKGMLAIILAMFLIYFLFIKNIDLYYMLSPFNQGLFGRIFISEIGSLYPHFAIFGDQTPHIGFASISNTLSDLLDIEHQKRSGEIVMATVNPHWVELAIGGTYNTLFIGEAYANFGWLGVMISIIWVLLYYYLILIYIKNFCSDHFFSLSIYIALNMSVMSGFNDFIYNPFLVIIILFFTNYKKLFFGSYAKK